MDFFQNDLGLPHQAHMDPKPACGHCLANKTTDNWFDFRPAARWRKTDPRPLDHGHPIHEIKGLSTWHFAMDWLHILDQGISCHAIGNVLFEIVYNRLGHLTKANAFTEVSNYIMAQPTEHGRLPPTLDIKNFINADKYLSAYPVLIHVKAAEVRSMVPIIASLARDFCDGSARSVHMRKMMDNLAGVYQVMHESGDTLGDRHTEFDKFVTSFLLEYTWLAKDAMNQVPYLPRWSVVPKFHYVVHLSQQAKLCNPKLVWTYGGEDFVGKISNLGHTVLPGTASFRVASSLMDRYQIAMHLRFSRRL
jgi:hypothetical protein